MARPIAELAEQLNGLCRPGSAPDRRPGQVLRLEVEAPEADPLSWLAHQPEFAMTYWRDRSSGREIAGLGTTMVVETLEPVDFPSFLGRLHAVLDETDAALHFHGGFAFACQRHGAVGKDGVALPRGRFVLPRFEVVRRPGQAPILACNLVARADRSLRLDAAAALEELEIVVWLSEPPSDSLPPVIGRVDIPDEADWHGMVEQALARIEAHGIDKVVLARLSEFTFAEPLQAAALLRRLAARTPGCYHFYTQPGPDLAFVGASPELLYERHGTAIASEALAGTRRRGDDPASDAALEQELLASEKDRREHRIVTDEIRRSLGPLCTDLDATDDVTVRKLARVQHLHQTIGGTLRPGITDAQILQALHPTPAVGGWPTSPALSVIRELEPFHRGWYAGPIGWVGRDEAAFSVGIRSGLVQDDKLSLYSGAGIVTGSQPDSEWREIEAKLGSFLVAIDG